MRVESLTMRETHPRRAAEMLSLIGALYAIERDAKDIADDAQLALRTELSIPVLNQIQAWLVTEAAIVMPRSPMREAITYAKNQWQVLITFTTQGFLAIDNNASERALKREALGRKNWLFAGHDEAAMN